MNEMTYTEWLEKEINIYKRENNLLNDKLENITTMFNEVHDNELETRKKKNDILKWGYSLEKENKQLKEKLKYADFVKATLFNDKEEYKEQISKLVSDNTKLQNDLFTKQLNEDESDDYIERLKNELFNTYLLQQDNEKLISELKLELSSYNNFVDEMFPD